MNAAQEDHQITLEGVKSEILRIAHASAERKNGYNVDFCKHVVNLYRERDAFGNEWRYEQLQSAVSDLQDQLDEDFAEEMMFLLKSLYVIGKGLIREDAERGSTRHLAINVRGDGSCFYQALFYSLLWACPGEMLEIRSVSELKRLVLVRLFGRKNVESNAAELRDKTRPEKTPDKEKRREYRRKLLLFESLVADFGGNVGGDVNTRFSNSAWFKTDNTPYMDEAFEIQVLIFTRTSANAASLLHSLDAAETRFTGNPVVLLLLSDNHFYILSRQPFVESGLVDVGNGKGMMGLAVPQSIEFEFMERESIMPILKMCMRCKKLVL